MATLSPDKQDGSFPPNWAEVRGANVTLRQSRYGTGRVGWGWLVTSSIGFRTYFPEAKMPPSRQKPKLRSISWLLNGSGKRLTCLHLA